MNLLESLDLLLPAVCEWVAAQEQYILRKGVELSSDQKIDAYQVGVKEIEKVRLMRVKQIPAPTNPMLKAASKELNLISAQTAGISFRYGIYVRSDLWTDRRLVVHELTHTMQYERFGGIKTFMHDYLHECLTDGYPFGALEQEATKMEKKICG